MDLKSLGEFGLISMIKSKFETISFSGVEGIGDDCAVIPKDSTHSYVVTTDMLVEGKHFILDKISPFELGYKSLAVNISDVASMGATPRFSFLSLAISSEIDQEWCEKFIEGYHSLSSEHGVALLGGDTTAAENGHLTISVTAIGEVKTKNIKRRSAAMVGDIVVVNTLLGDSALALKMMLDGESVPSSLMKMHTMPKPQVSEGIWLGERKEVHAMMDISDGITSDLEHICKLSGCGAKIFTSQIPNSEMFMTICKEHGWNQLDFSLAGGEDYGLLMTVDRTRFDRLRKHYFGSLFPIGVITEGCGVEYINEQKEAFSLKKGFRHF